MSTVESWNCFVYGFEEKIDGKWRPLGQKLAAPTISVAEVMKRRITDKHPVRIVLDVREEDRDKFHDLFVECALDSASCIKTAERLGWMLVVDREMVLSFMVVTRIESALGMPLSFASTQWIHTWVEGIAPTRFWEVIL